MTKLEEPGVGRDTVQQERAFATQTDKLEFDLKPLQDGRKPTPKSCPLVSTPIPWHVHTHAHTCSVCRGLLTHRQGSISTSSSTIPAAKKQRNSQDYNQDADPCSPGPRDRHVQQSSETLLETWMRQPPLFCSPGKHPTAPNN